MRVLVFVVFAARNVETSDHTSVQARVSVLRDAPEKAHEPLRPIVGLCVFRLPRRSEFPTVLDDCSQTLPEAAVRLPRMRRSLGACPCLFLGSGYWRIVGSVETLIERAEAAGQSWMKGVGFARRLAATQ